MPELLRAALVIALLAAFLWIALSALRRPR